MSKYRKREGLFLAEGFRCVEQILENGTVTVNELLVHETFEDVEPLLKFDRPVYSLPADDFDSVSDTENPQGVIAVCQTPAETDLEKLTLFEGVVIATDAIQDPGNLGTIIRTASWFGVAGMIFGTGTVDPFHPKVVRSTAGATGTLPSLSGNLLERLHQLEENGWEILLLDGGPEASDIKKIKPRNRQVLVVGNEANGISDELLQSGKKRVKIVGDSGKVESLNAAISVGIGLHQLTGK